MKKLLSSIFLSAMAFVSTHVVAADQSVSKYSYITIIDNNPVEQPATSVVAAPQRKLVPIQSDLPKQVLPVAQAKPEISQSHQDLNTLHDGRPQGQKSTDPLAFGLNKAGTVASEKVESYLNQYGTAKVNLKGNDKFKTGSVDILIPLHTFTENDKHLFFTQVGGRRSNYGTDLYRTTLNLGLGYRYFTDDNWMFGINTFYDRDITRGHQRMGMGVEAWTDNLKLSANTYHRLSDWKDSPDLVNYQERPANGFDVRAEGSLPNLPQLTGKVMYEKYKGEEVGLFGKDDRQKDASALTVGLKYTPVPMLSIGVDHRMGRDGQKETKFNIALNYQIGVPLSKQLDSNRVGQGNKLSMNRTALVERNNEIVLEYKIKPVGNIRLPDLINGNPTSVITFPIVVTTNTALSNYTWTGTGAPFMSPYVNGSASGVITLPVYSTTSVNTYTLQLSAKDISGRVIQSNVLTIIVDGYTLTITPSKPTAHSDGVDAVTFTAKLTDKNNIAVPNKTIGWAVRNANMQSSQTVTDANGEVRAVITSTLDAVAEVDAIDMENGTKATGTVLFSGNPNTATVYSIVASDAFLVAGGTATTTLTANVRDINGNILGAGIPVTWTTTGGTLLGSTSLTDVSGNAVMSLKSGMIVGTATVNAKAASPDIGKNVIIGFTADLNSIKVNSITAPPTHIVSTTVPILISAEVTDQYGNIVGAGHVVTWTGTSPGNGTFQSPTSVTDANGIAVNQFMGGTVSGVAVLNARAGVAPAKTANVQLLADPGSARVIDLNPALLNGEANGVTEILFFAKVADGYGNLYADDQAVPVHWTSPLGKLASATTVTGQYSRSMVILTADTHSGQENMRVKANASDPGLTSLITYAALDEHRQDAENYIEFFECGSKNYDTTQGTYLVWNNEVLANGIVQLPYTYGPYTYYYSGIMKDDPTTTTCNGNQTGYRATSGINRKSQ